MSKKESPRRELPVDLDRLRSEFPQLDEGDLEAYATITRRVLADPAAKARVMRELMATAQAARQKAATGGSLIPDEALALRYLLAVEKMQRSTVRRPN